MIAPQFVVATASVTACVLVSLAGAGPLERREVARLDGSGSVVGATFSGSEVLYMTDNVERPAVYSVGPNGPVRIYEAPHVPLPPRFQDPSSYESRVFQNLDSLDASPGVVAFVRRVGVSRIPKCRPSCMRPGDLVWLFYEVRARLGSGRFQRVAGGPGRCPAGQFWPHDVAVTGRQVVYSGRLDGCKKRRLEHRVVAATFVGQRPTRDVVTRFPLGGFTQVTASRRFLAWNRDRGELPTSDLRDPRLVVYDQIRRRIAYTVTLPSRLRVDMIGSLDVQSDGKVAAWISREGNRCYILQVVWSSPSEQPRLRFVPGRSSGSSQEVRLVGDRLMFVRSAGGCQSFGSDLVVASLDGSNVRVLGHYDPRNSPQRFPGPSFDFDGKRSAFPESALYRDGSGRGWTSIFVDQARN